MEEQYKTPAQSYTEQVQLLHPSNMNGNNRLYGGQLMAWIDTVAVVAARRHSGCAVTTALVERLEFKEPALLDSLVVLAGKVVYAGNTSMEVCVKSYVESMSGVRRLINSAHLTLVALDEHGRPCRVPPLKPETEGEQQEWEDAKRRREERKRRG